MAPTVIIGAGPAGLTAARALIAGGVTDVTILERNPEAGGLPRFCGHLGWGFFDYHRIWSGPRYARRLVEDARGATIRTNVSVTALGPGGVLEISTPQGRETLTPRAVLLAAGIRETSRAARLIGGTRPWGVVSTGAFQEMVYAGGQMPFRRPVVIGTELVSFSALLTARHAGIRPVAMIEEAARITARRPGDLFARHLLGVPVLTRTRLVSIEGTSRVDGVIVEENGVERRIDCDGVIVTGRFAPEAALLRGGPLALDPATGGPQIDCFYRTSDPAIFAAGNVLRPVEHSGQAAAEGAAAAAAMLRDHLPAPAEAIPVTPAGALRYAYPQHVFRDAGAITLYARASQAHRGTLRLKADGHTLVERRIDALPERRITLTIPEGALTQTGRLELELA
ncbi:NAD(P)/FAD-dependent oxidoreductase [Roseomonas sp. 18066]|uniref:NAD(P)/FAD-dependent oxidoreductase n=1 Tax=Roseomonas sp. 18066 TaxID=2681412 RepID=UPI00135C64DB|nr:FAD-dependent oxidoreductase [Roseomonas sp. 18066]